MKKVKEPTVKFVQLKKYTTIGDRIKQVREALGYTQTEFADRIGVGFSSISKLEANINNPSPRTVKGICHEFGVNINWLRSGTGEMFHDRLTDEEITVILRPFFDNARIEAALQLLNMPADEFEAWTAAFNAFRFYTKKGGNE